MPLPIRKNLRLPQYDYAQNGAYFITICTHEKRCILSEIRRGGPCGRPELRLTPLGALAVSVFTEMEQKYGVRIPAWVMMPNHVHFMLIQERAAARAAPTVSAVVGAYKSIVAVRWLKRCKAQGVSEEKLWQRGFYDHVIRDARDYEARLQYMEGNPARWAQTHPCENSEPKR